MANLRDNRATSALNEDQYINKIYDQTHKNQQQAIQAGQTAVMGQVDAGQQFNRNQTQQYQQRTDVEGDRAAQNIQKTVAQQMGRGNHSMGAQAQAGLSMGNQQQSNKRVLNSQQSAADAEYERQRKNLADLYSTRIKQAQESNDMQRAQALLEAARAEEEQLRKFRQQGAQMMTGVGDNSILNDIVNGTPVQRDTTSESWGEVTRNDDAINKIYDAQIRQQQLGAEQQAREAMSDLEAQQQKTVRDTDQELNKIYVNSLRSNQANREAQNASGINSGVAMQDAISRQNAMTGDLTEARRLQAVRDAQNQGQRIDKMRALQDAIQKAQAAGDEQRAKALYEAAEKEEQKLVDEQLFAGQQYARQGDYSILGKLFGLTPEQIARLNGGGDDGYHGPNLTAKDRANLAAKNGYGDLTPNTDRPTKTGTTTPTVPNSGGLGFIAPSYSIRNDGSIQKNWKRHNWPKNNYSKKSTGIAGKY